MMKNGKLLDQIPSFLINSTSYYVVITNLEGKYIFVNDCFKQRFSFVTDDFINKDSFIAIYPLDHQTCSEAGKKCLENPNEVVRVDLRKPDTNSDDFYWTQWEYSAFRDKNNEIIGVFCLGHDVTETEKASRKAMEFANKVETIIDEITDGFYQLDRDWNFMKFNKVAEQALGVTKKEVIGKCIWDLFPVSEEYNYPKLYRKAMSENLTLTFEEYHAHNHHWYNVVVYPSVEGLSVFFKDITTEKQNLAKIKQQEYFLNAIYNSTKEATTFVDTNFIVRFANKVAQNITFQVFGKKMDMGVSTFDYYLPEYVDEFKKFYNKVLLGETITVERTDGTNWWQFSLYPVYDENIIIGIANNITDITERKDKEIKLIESEHKLQKNIEAIPHPMLIVSEDVEIQFVNLEFEKVFGYNEEEVLGKSINFLIPERFRNGHDFLHKDYLEQGGNSIRMGRFASAITKDGNEISIDASLNTFTAGGKKFIIVILQDVTELKKHQDTILQQNEALRSIAWEQSHKLRTPVANILSLCDLLTNSDGESEEEKSLYIQFLIESAKSLDAIVHKIVGQANENEFTDK